MMIETTRSQSPAIRFLDPHAEPGAAAEPYLPRLSIGSSPVTIGLMSNLFTDASALLEDLETPLRELLSNVEFRFYDKEHVRNASFPSPASKIELVTAECDAVICAYGHCGSCTAGTVRDVVAFARSGLPAVALVTRKFVAEAHFIARSGGIPGIPFVFLPHPIAGQDEELHQAVARAIAPAILQALTHGDTADSSKCLRNTHLEALAI
jgi:hypothetical protein